MKPCLHDDGQSQLGVLAIERARVPSILRRLPDGHPQLIGQRYLHGIMNVELKGEMPESVFKEILIV